jgi:exopolyphosphatase/guanosine-5'-triphosphate,3'-diphosphate pyrophosphatase
MVDDGPVPMSSAVRVAAFDCGTNAIRLLIADVTPDRLVDVLRDMRIVRLGEGVDRTGEFSPAALERLFAALAEFRILLDESRPQRVRFVATSASRDVSNRADFSAGVLRLTGVEPEVISGQEEAELSFLGAVQGQTALPAPVLAFDIGGGSTEVILGGPDGLPTASVSVDIGCVRMAERHLHADPATAEQIDAMRADVQEAIGRAAAAVPMREAAGLVGLSGTVTTVAAIAHDLPSYDAAAIHGLVVTRTQVDEIVERLLGMTAAERAAMPVMHPGRVDVIGAGALILQEVMAAAGASTVRASEADLLDGIAFRLFRG